MGRSLHRGGGASRAKGKGQRKKEKGKRKKETPASFRMTSL
jgi:hypothetical protein